MRLHGSQMSCDRFGLISCMQIQPHFHQAETLKATVEDQIVKEGLIGVGVGAGLLDRKSVV